MSSSGYAPQLKNSSSPKSNAPCSPFLIATYFGPISRIFRPALIRLVSLVICARFAVVQNEQVDARQERVEIGARRFDPKIHRVGDDETRPLHLIEHVGLKFGRDVGQQDEIVSRDRLAGSVRAEMSKTLSATDRVSRVFRSHVYSPDQRNVFPATRCTPSASILRDFQKSNSDAGKIVADDADQIHRGKKLAPRAA